METPQLFEIYCAGEFCRSDKNLEVANPYDKTIVATTFLADAALLECAITAAEAVRAEMADMPVHKRSHILKQISGDLLALQAQFAEIISLEAGKPIKNALAEVDRSIQTFLVASEECKRLPGEYLRIDWTTHGEGKEAWVKHFPVGLVAGIAPFNFPLNLAVHKIAPAIAAGCPIILKPSSLTPLSTLLLAQIISRTELPKGAVSILPMNRPTGNQLVTDPRFALLSFTGSPEVGWKMKREAGKKKVVLELGGNAGVIVSQSADVELAINKCIAGAFSYAGQVCIHTQRIYVQRECFQEFADKFIAKTKTLKVGNPLDAATDMAGMIDEANAIRVEQWIEQAVAGGARVLAGGKRNGTLVEPTILTNTQSPMLVCSEEVFGPVVIIEPFDTFSEAICLINAGRFGLQSGVFTDSVKEMDEAFNRLQVGGVIINDVPTFRVDHMPYGGIKDSGLGREGVKYAMLDMLEPKVLVKGL